jgi:hypothetical protein
VALANLSKPPAVVLFLHVYHLRVITLMMLHIEGMLRLSRKHMSNEGQTFLQANF